MKARCSWLAVGSLCLGVILSGAARAGECHDALITAGVKVRLASDDVIGVFKINVDTEECVVTLRGCVDSPDQVKRAKNLARKSKGVRSVSSQLSICGKKSAD